MKFIIVLFLLVILIFYWVKIVKSFRKKYLFSNQFKEGFELVNTWPEDLIQRFLIYQRTIGENNYSYNIDIVQKQATAKEAEDLLKNGYWYWPDYLKEEYMEKVKRNNLIKIDPKVSLDSAMKVYNQNAMKELLAWNAKEGNLLLYGVDLGVTDGLPENLHNTIKCSNDKTGNTVMQKKVYTGVNLWNGYSDYKLTNLKNEDLPDEIPGFSFVKSPCNPCSNLDLDRSSYICPFEIRIKKDPHSDLSSNSDFKSRGISRIWKDLWNL